MRCAIAALVGVVLAGSHACAQPQTAGSRPSRRPPTLRIAYRTDSRPFSFVDAQGRPTGYTIELCRRIAKSLEQQLDVPGGDQVGGGRHPHALRRDRQRRRRHGVRIDDGVAVAHEDRRLLQRGVRGVHRRAGQVRQRGVPFDSMAGKSIGVIAGTTNARAVRDQLERRKLAIYHWSSSATARRASRRWRAARSTALPTTSWPCWRAARAANPRDFGCCPRTCRSSRSRSCCRAATGRSGWRSTRPGAGFPQRRDRRALHQLFRRRRRAASGWAGAVFIFGGLPEQASPIDGTHP